MNNGKSSWGLINFVAVIILVAILIFGGSLLGTSVSKKQSEKEVAGLTNQFQPVVVKTVKYDGVEGKTVLELLKSTHQVATQDSSIGSFVTSIDGDTNTDDTYWMVYVNDQLSSEGSGYITKTGDKIEWRYEKLQ